MLTREADVRAAVADPRLSSERTQAYLSELPSVDRERFRTFVTARSDMLLFCDGEKHRRLRRAVVGAVRSLEMASFRGVVERNVARLLDDLGDAREVELVAEFALPLPIAVLLDILGIPSADRDRVRACATTFNLAIGGVIRPDLVARAHDAIEDLSLYLSDFLAGGPPASPIAARLFDEQRAGRLSAAEVHASFLMLITAGHETVSNLLGNSAVALLRNPAELGWLRDNPAAIGTAIDELLRYDAPVQLTAREAKAVVVLGDKEIQPGERVIPLWGAANRDPAAFDTPGRLDLRRPGRTHHLSFGAGRHRCLGAPLARVEAVVALSALVSRLRGMTLVQSPEWKENFSFRGPQRLVVASAVG